MKEIICEFCTNRRRNDSCFSTEPVTYLFGEGGGGTYMSGGGVGTFL